MAEARGREDERLRAPANKGAIAVAAVLSALLAAIPAWVSPASPLMGLAWCGALALPAGVACGLAMEGRWAALLAGVGSWVGASAVLLLRGLPPGATAGSSLWALAALGLFGVGLGRVLPRSTTSFGAALLVALVATFASTSLGLLARTPGEISPALGAFLVDLSPAALVVETGGGDWMRAPGIYDPAGTEWFSDRRAAYPSPWSAGPRAAFERSGMKSLATPLLGVVGCALVFSSRRRHRPTPP